MSINREKHKKSCGHSLELLSVEPNILIVSWGQVCDNFLATIVWGQILSKKSDICLKVIHFLFDFCVKLVLPLLLCVIFPTILDNISKDGRNK